MVARRAGALLCVDTELWTASPDSCGHAGKLKVICLVGNSKGQVSILMDGYHR